MFDTEASDLAVKLSLFLPLEDQWAWVHFWVIVEGCWNPGTVFPGWAGAKMFDFAALKTIGFRIVASSAVRLREVRFFGLHLLKHPFICGAFMLAVE